MYSYKTKMCWHYLNGNCKFGNSCSFAHGEKDLVEPSITSKASCDFLNDDINQVLKDITSYVQF
jgi:hypothetical protein